MSKWIDDDLAEGRASPVPTLGVAVLEGGKLPVALRRKAGPALADQELELGELRGVPVVLNFWASWCGPCRHEAPALEAGWRRDRERGVLYLGLDMQDLSDDARDFLDEFEITYPTIRDPGVRWRRATG